MGTDYHGYNYGLVAPPSFASEPGTDPNYYRRKYADNEENDKRQEAIKAFERPIYPNQPGADPNYFRRKYASENDDIEPTPMAVNIPPIAPPGFVHVRVPYGQEIPLEYRQLYDERYLTVGGHGPYIPPPPEVTKDQPVPIHPGVNPMPIARIAPPMPKHYWKDMSEEERRLEALRNQRKPWQKKQRKDIVARMKGLIEEREKQMEEEIAAAEKAEAEERAAKKAAKKAAREAKMANRKKKKAKDKAAKKLKDGEKPAEDSANTGEEKSAANEADTGKKGNEKKGGCVLM